MMNKDTKTLYDFIPNYPKGSTKPFIVKLGSKNTFDEISIFEKDIISNLTNVYDPEIPVNIYDLGLIYDVIVDEDNNVDVKMTLTTPNCPVAESLPMEVENTVKEVKDVKKVNLELVWDPPWDKSMITEAGKLELNL